MSGLVYVTTEDCHFCEHGRGVLDALGIARAEIAADSAEAEALAERGIPLSSLPVLTDGTGVVAYGRFSETALESLAFVILEEHVEHSVAGVLASGDATEAQPEAEELLEAVHRFAKVH